MIKKKYIILILCLALQLSLKSQDFHFSMFNYSPLTLNPALTGVFDYDYKSKDTRVIANFRQQWRSIPSAYINTPTPFNTTSFSIEHALRVPKILRRDFIGLGGVFYRDRSGDLFFTTQQVTPSISYNKSLNRRGTQYLTLGFQYGIVRRSIDYANAFFDNQWTGTTFDPSAATGENLPSNQFYYTDLSAGLLFQHNPERGIKFKSGVALYHINNPNQSFNANEAYHVFLYRKLVVHADAQIQLQPDWTALPFLLYMRQGTASEVDVGSFVKYKVKNKTSYKIGLGYRIVGNDIQLIASDALIAAIVFGYDNFELGFSYDTNTSGLRQATNLRGGFEICLTYHEKFRKHKTKYSKFKDGVPECPDFYHENNSF